MTKLLVLYRGISLWFEQHEDLRSMLHFILVMLLFFLILCVVVWFFAEIGVLPKEGPVENLPNNDVFPYGWPI